ncbi:hypothetical protein NUU61_006769 [Penicillium alfredii]|uniref:OTU domain-containing protein n=1 Tax=Penicillium alfredii TaxID=1506179 RepID=A0A9W9F1M0_9EURO|nr:uncharacterized protein NUU61_006769 [Penicillium alfredii]KAJ5091899.1 hypothetical protein NUU61_006769 [Penicillium alfredii]
MSHLTHGGRIVPILAGPQQHEPATPETAVVKNDSGEHLEHANLLQDQRDGLSAMTRQSKALDHESLEMPCLKERDLFALPTEGDGGGERRRPKRAAASAYATRSADVSAPSEEEKERRFEEMVASTRKNSEWGSSEHLQAFCQVFKVDVNVYTMDGVQVFRDVHAPADQPRDVVHVAFHVSLNLSFYGLVGLSLIAKQDFKHYSSVRSMDGIHKGLFTQKAYLDRLQEPSKKLGDAKDGDIASDEKTRVLDSSADKDAGLAVDLYAPWDIKSIQEGLGGRYDRETIVDMLQKCRGDIDRAFAALLDEKSDTSADKKVVQGPPLKPSLQASRSSSPFSTGSKRSADDSDDSEDPRPATRRVRPKRRIVSNLTLGVGISFRDDHNELVSLNLRMKSDSEKGQSTDSASDIAPSEFSEMDRKNGPRRSGRISRPRPV